MAVALLAAGSVLTAGGVITGVPLGIKVALVLINLSAILGAVLVPTTVNDLMHHRGTLSQRLVLAVSVPVVIAAVPFLDYWNLLGLRY